MKNGSRFFKMKDGMKVNMNNGFAYEYNNFNDNFIEFEVKNRLVDGIDYQIEVKTGKTFTAEQLNNKYEN